jgi:pheromone a factor receptor
MSRGLSFPFISCTAGSYLQTISVSTLFFPSKMVPEVPNYIISALCFIGFIIVMIPFPWHWKSAYSCPMSDWGIVANRKAASNRGTCLYMVWTALACLNQFINSVVWNKNAINKAPVWCDICEVFFSKKITPPHNQSNTINLLPYLEATRIIVGLSIALPAASLCITRHIYQITCLQSINLSKVGGFNMLMRTL